jgi:acetyl esterase
MPIYDRDSIPDSVSRGTLDPELEQWLPNGPTLGADVSIPQGRRDHTVLGGGPWPDIGAVDTLVLPGPHGSLAVRRHTPTEPSSSPSGARVYIHGGGFTYGTLDEFEVPMRLIAERAGIATYAIEYQLAPRRSSQRRSTRSSSSCGGCSTTQKNRAWTPRRSQWAGTRRAAT